MRIKIFRVIVICLFLFIAGQLTYVQLIKGSYFFDLSKNNRIRMVPLEGKRGRIFDRNGVVLADNKLTFNVMVIPQEIKNPEKMFDFLSETLDIPKEKLIKNYKQRSFGPFAPVVLVESIPKEMAMLIEENTFRFPSLLVQESFQRMYPYAHVGAHVLGYVGKINADRLDQLGELGYSSQSIIGYSGIEEFYDRQLKGEQGGLQIEVNSRGQQVRLLSLKEPVGGEDLFLTIDQKIQQISTDLLTGRKGAIVIMDMETGEILSMVSSPAFNPNVFVQNVQTETTSLFSNPDSPLLNRVISGQYPPGSVFKIPVALCALNLKKVTKYTTFHCPGSLKMGDREFRCTHVHGDQDLYQAIAHSCNIYFYQVGRIVGSDQIAKYAKYLGLNYLTDIDLPYEASGQIPGRQQRRQQKKPWYQGDTLNLSIGQGEVLSTPIQLMSMMATVAQDGVWVQPHLVKMIGTKPMFESPQKKVIPFPDENFEIVKEGMGLTVSMSSGTAHELDIPGLITAGKTGTAQTSGKKDHHAWFVGYTKSQSNPLKIAFCVFLEFGGSSQNANAVAKDLLLRMKEQNIL